MEISRLQAERLIRKFRREKVSLNSIFGENRDCQYTIDCFDDYTQIIEWLNPNTADMILLNYHFELTEHGINFLCGYNKALDKYCSTLPYEEMRKTIVFR